MNELPVGTTFREALYLASATSSEQNCFYESSLREQMAKKFSALGRRLRCASRPELYRDFTVTWRELKAPVPFAKTQLSNFVQNTITTEGKN